MNNFNVVLATIYTFLFIAACDKDKTSSGGDAAVSGGVATHCIEGKLSDGLTGEWLSLDDTRIYVIHNDRLYDNFRKTNERITVEEERQAELQGLFSLCDLPNTGATVPLWVKKVGFQDRAVNITLSSATPNKGEETNSPGFWAPPIVRADVSVFKYTDLQQKDFTVSVFSHGKPVEGANVYLTRSDNSGTVPPVIAATSATGQAVYPASGLAFGATYKLTIIPKTPAGTGGEFVPPVLSTSIVIGTVNSITAGTGLVAASPFSIHADLSSSSITKNSAPILVSRTPNKMFDAEGKITIIFDRSIRLSEGSKTVTGGATASFSSFGTKATGGTCTAADHGSPVFDATNNVTFTVSDNSLVVSPNFSTAPSFSAECAGIEISYVLTGLKVYSAASEGPMDVFNPTGSFLIYISKP